MKTFHAKSHGVQVDSNIPENLNENGNERDRERERGAPGGPATNTTQTQGGIREHKPYESRTKNRTDDRKKNNREVIHTAKSTKQRKTALKNSPGHKTLNVITINPDSLVNNDRLRETVGRMNKKLIHIACIQETHICKNITKWVENYRFINIAAKEERTEQNAKKYTGGVGMLIEQNLAEHIISIESEDGRILKVTLDNTEVPNSKPLTIICTYAPHSGYRCKDRRTHWNMVNKWIESVPRRRLLIWCADANGQIAKDDKDDDKIEGPYTNATYTEKGNGESLYRTCKKNALRPMNTWRENGKNGKGDGERDYTTWTSPDGKTRRQIDYIMVRKEHQNAVNECQTIRGWRGNYNQQRQHAVVGAKINMSWALNYLHNNRQTSKQINGEIKYDRNALNNGKAEMEKWAEEEGEIQIDDEKKGDSEHIWGRIEEKLQNMITTKFPPTNKTTKTKDESWARGEEKEQLIRANKNTNTIQKAIEKNDKNTYNYCRKLTLLRTIIAWREVAKYSKCNNIYWARKEIINIGGNTGNKKELEETGRVKGRITRNTVTGSITNNKGYG